MASGHHQLKRRTGQSDHADAGCAVTASFGRQALVLRGLVGDGGSNISRGIGGIRQDVEH